MMPQSNALTKTRLTTLQEFSLFGVFLTISLFRLGTELFGSETLTPAKIFVGMTFMLWMANILINKDSEAIITLMREKANILLLLFLAITFISLINARYFQDETVSETFLRIKMAVLYFLIVGIIKDRRTFKIAFLAFIVGGLLTTGAGLFEFASGNSFLTKSYNLFLQQEVEGLRHTQYGEAARVQGLYGDPGYHANAIVIFFGLVLPWLFYSTSKVLKISVGIILTCYVLNVIGTGARFGWISLGCSLFVFLLLFKHRYKYSIWVISIASVIILFLGSSLISHVPTFARLQYTKDKAFSWRLETYQQSLDMVRDYPLLGVGTGNYFSEYHNYLRLRPSLSRYHEGWIHNAYLQIWAENGIIGLVIFLLFFLTICLGLLAVYLNAVDLEMKALALGLISAFTGTAVEFSGIPALGQEPGWLLLGLCVALISIDRKEREQSLDFSIKRTF